MKFHFDEVKDLGMYIEVEAIDTTGTLPKIDLQNLCEYYFDFFGLHQDQLVSMSYSDLLLEKQ